MNGDETTDPSRASDAHCLGDEWAPTACDGHVRSRAVVRDAGRTGIGPGSATVIAARPALSRR